MKRLLVLTIPLFLLTSCLNDVVSNILYPYSEPNKHKVPDTPPSPLEKMDIKGKNRETVGWYYRLNMSAPVVIYFHGNGENLQTLFEGHFFQMMNSFQVNYAVFDYPLYGLSTGELNEKGVLQAGQDVIDFVKAQYPGLPIVLWGQSLGCAPATILTSKNQDVVKKLIVTSPWDEFWREIKFKANLDDSTCKDLAKGNEYLSDVASQSITIPVLIHHGTEDEVVKFDLGKHLSESFANNSKNVTFVPVPGYHHNDILIDSVVKQINAFIHQ